MTHTTGFPAPEAVPLLEEALQKLGPDDSPSRRGPSAAWPGTWGHR
jgi:hypothetical protein